jgi:hypothetical protein
MLRPAVLCQEVYNPIAAPVAQLLASRLTSQRTCYTYINQCTAIMASSTRRTGGGRIHPYQRDTDDVTPILGDLLELETNEDFQSQYHETLRASMDDKARKDYRCRIQRIAKFWEAKCPEYFNIGTRLVSHGELQDITKFHFNRYKYDLIYKGLNVKYVLHFLRSTKTKSNGKIKGCHYVGGQCFW